MGRTDRMLRGIAEAFLTPSQTQQRFHCVYGTAKLKEQGGYSSDDTNTKF